MDRQRRDLLALIGAVGTGVLGAGAVGLPGLAQAAAGMRTMTDSAGRSVTLPDRVAKIFPAGPPASIFTYMIAPDLMAGWTRALRGAERAGIPAKYHDLPTTGRLTGRGGSANLETVMAMKPDLILDYGSVLPTYVSLADRVQAQTGIPYALIDGRFDNIPASFVTVGDLIGRPERGRACAARVQAIVSDLAAARARVLDRFTLERSVAQYRRLYGSFAAGGRVSVPQPIAGAADRGM